MQVDVSQASNVLDRWINAASRTLTCFVTEEMNGYRLYTVVPVLIKFINDLTNIYVRYNRRRLKGSKGSEDTLMALVSLYDVLLTVCKVRQSQQMVHAVVKLAASPCLCCVGWSLLIASRVVWYLLIASRVVWYLLIASRVV